MISYCCSLSDFTLDDCIRGSQSPSITGAGAGRRPFLDTYAQRALLFEGIAAHTHLSAVARSETAHVRRVAATLRSSEPQVLTFQLERQTCLKSAYRGLATEEEWKLSRVSGEFEALQVRVPPKFFSVLGQRRGSF